MTHVQALSTQRWHRSAVLLAGQRMLDAGFRPQGAEEHVLSIFDSYFGPHSITALRGRAQENESAMTFWSFGNGVLVVVVFQ